jgi:hypothetical protein
MGLLKKIMKWLRCIRTETTELIEDLEDIGNYEEKYKNKIYK